MQLSTVLNPPGNRNRSIPRPRPLLLVVATVVALSGSLLACAVLVLIGVSVFPDTAGYVHFQFSDYAKLTTIGVLVGCIAWPVFCAVFVRPRLLYLWATILASVVLLAPDAWILLHGAPPHAVIILVAMHLAVAAATLSALLILAPPALRPMRVPRSAARR
ncbi:MAG TPA: hypothetical protein VHU90_05485 [Galbitalea sp.]|jgi:hypothetical protein|nr:hypothetical protein [Galbitalea sp.]